MRIRILHICKKDLAKQFPVKDIDTHRCKIALRVFRFFFEFNDTSVTVCVHDTETACFLHRYFDNSDGSVCIHFLVVIQHLVIIHLVDMVAGENQKIFW